MERSSIVVECELKRPIGTDHASRARLIRFLEKICKTIKVTPLRQPVIHLSPKYGLSGWAPANPHSAIHLYSWDIPRFMSLDIACPQANLSPQAIIQTVRNSFEIQRLVWKTPDNSDKWQDIENGITRQRLHIHAKRSQPPSREEIKQYKIGLCSALSMLQLSEVQIEDSNDQTSAWVHWETSGTMLNWDSKSLTLDIQIYTCKSFDPEHAVEFTKANLRLEEILNVTEM